jgi:hypothetical protein
MLQDSPGERAKKLNELVGLDIIDRIFKKLNSKITLTKSEITRTEAEKVKNQEQLDELDYLAAVELQIVQISNELDKHTKMQEKANAASTALDKLCEIDEQIAKQKEVLKYEDIHHKLSCAICDWELLNAEINQLTDLTKALKAAGELIKEDSEWLKVEKDYQSLVQKRAARSTKFQESNALEASLVSYRNLNFEYNNQNTLLDEAIMEYAALLRDTGVCPICTSKIDATLMQKVINKLEG